MAEIGEPAEKPRRVLVPALPGVVPNENPYKTPTPQHEPAREEPPRPPEKVPA